MCPSGTYFDPITLRCASAGTVSCLGMSRAFLILISIFFCMELHNLCRFLLITFNSNYYNYCTHDYSSHQWPIRLSITRRQLPHSWTMYCQLLHLRRRSCIFNRKFDPFKFQWNFFAQQNFVNRPALWDITLIH